MRNLARERDLLKYKWFSHHFDKFVAVLYGRYLMLTIEGTFVSSPYLLVRTVWTDDPRPHWMRKEVSNSYTRVKTRDRLESLIRTVDKRALEERA